MPFPPDPIAADKAPGPPSSSTEHPDHHNEMATAINDIVAHIEDYINVVSYGAAGDGSTDDTTAIQAAIDAAEANLGGVVYFPAGQYVTTSPLTVAVSSIRLVGEGTTVSAEISDGTVIYTRHAGIGIDILATAAGCTVEHITLSGANSSGVHTGGAGLVLRGGERHLVFSSTFVNYLQAGLVLEGTQNSLILNTGAYYCKYNYWLVNNTRNCRFINANATDATSNEFAIPAAMTAMAPDARALMVGFATNTIGITEVVGDLLVPSHMTFRDCIWERYDRHDYIVELAQGWDIWFFDSCELTYAKTACMKIGADFTNAGRAAAGENANVYWQRVTADPYDRVLASSNSIVEHLNQNLTSLWIDDRNILRRDRTLGDANWIESITSRDFQTAKHILDGPTSFAHIIPNYVVGGTGTATHDSVNRHFEVSSPGNGLGWIDVPFATPWNNVANPWTWDANHKIRIAYDVASVSPNPAEIQVTLTGAPWVRSIGTIDAAGQGFLEYQCQGDESSAIRVISANAGASTVDFRYLAATVDEFAVSGGSGLANIVEDTTPQLGGNLDTNGNEIVFPATLGDKVTLYDGGAGADFKLGIAAFTIYADTGSLGGLEVREAGAAAHTRLESAGATIPAGSLATHAAQRGYVDAKTVLHDVVITVPENAIETDALSPWRAPRDGTLVEVECWCDTAPTTASWITDIHKNGTTVFTTQASRPTVATGTTGDKSATPDVTTITAGDLFQPQIDQLNAADQNNLGAMYVRITWSEPL